ncbi:MAG: cupin, partial [Mesorhizobium sp.]
MREASEDGQAPAAIGAGTAAAHAQQVLGVRLKALRLARRLSLRDLAEATGTSASFIS